MNPIVCVLGAGRMGSSIVRALLLSGHAVWVWNRTAAKTAPLAEAGAKVAETAAEAVRAADLVIVNVLDYDVSDRILRTPAVVEALAGKTLVQLTSGSPRLARDQEAWAKVRSVAYLDGAIMATPDFIGRPEAALLYAGSRSAYERYEPTLRLLGAAGGYVGEDAGLASALDTALLTQMWGALFGALQGLAVAQAEGVAPSAFLGHLRAFKPVVDAAVVDAVERGGAGRTRADEATLATLAAHYSAFQHLLEVTKVRGIDPALPEALDSLFRRAAAAGRLEDDDFAALAPLVLGREEDLADA
ncbi:NAD(P)-dependent oxidoreductase [Phenylobacterium terrae]|uniref:NAD(P)-dependent oxidoreductase n=1 Tax=Phenylobacterium terrae TaxID=2665495 RepID=A0ABW4N421_9CAUL